MKLLLFSLLIVIGCDNFEHRKLVVDIDKEFQPYVNTFIAEGKAQGYNIQIVDLIMEFSDLGRTKIGECITSRNTTPTILMDRYYWTAFDVTQREVSIFHEMGHCVLNRDHLSTWTGNHVTSIMYPSIQPEWMYLTYWGYYMWELFHE